MAVSCEILTKGLNILCGLNTKFLVLMDIFIADL